MKNLANKSFIKHDRALEDRKIIGCFSQEGMGVSGEGVRMGCCAMRESPKTAFGTPMPSVAFDNFGLWFTRQRSDTFPRGCRGLCWV